jgi:hypothetical protein
VPLHICLISLWRRCSGYSESKTAASSACLRVRPANLPCRCRAWRGFAVCVCLYSEMCHLFCWPSSRLLQALTQQKLEETCVIKGSVVALPWCSHCYHAILFEPPELTHISRSRQFKYFAKDFGDTESERLITLARLMGSKGDALLKVKLPFDMCAIRHSLPPLNLAAVV